MVGRHWAGDRRQETHENRAQRGVWNGEEWQGTERQERHERPSGEETDKTLTIEGRVGDRQVAGLSVECLGVVVYRWTEVRFVRVSGILHPHTHTQTSQHGVLGTPWGSHWHHREQHPGLRPGLLGRRGQFSLLGPEGGSCC